MSDAFCFINTLLSETDERLNQKTWFVWLRAPKVCEQAPLQQQVKATEISGFHLQRTLKTNGAATRKHSVATTSATFRSGPGVSTFAL